MFLDELEVKGGFSLVSNCLISFHFLRFVVSSLSSSFLFVAIQHDYNPRILLRPYSGLFLSFFFFFCLALVCQRQLILHLLHVLVFSPFAVPSAVSQQLPRTLVRHIPPFLLK